MRLAITFICAAGLYLLWSGEFDHQNLWAAAAGGAITTAADALMHRRMPGSRVPARMFGALATALARLPAATVRTGAGLTAATFTGRPPSAEEPRDVARRGEAALDRGRRALWIIGESLSPDSFVIGFPPDRDSAQMHILRGRRERGR